MNKAQLAEYRSYYDTFGNMPSNMILDLFEAAEKSIDEPAEETPEAPKAAVKRTKAKAE